MAIVDSSTRNRESKFQIPCRSLATVTSKKPQNIPKNPSTSSSKLPVWDSKSVLKKHRPSDVFRDQQQPMKRQKTGFEELPKSVSLNVSESKRDIQIPVQISETAIGSDKISLEKARRIELIKNRFADTIARAQKKLGRDAPTVKFQVPRRQETTPGRNSLQKQSQATKIAMEQMKQTVQFKNGMESERKLMKVLGCFNGEKEKKNLLAEDLEEGEIRVHTISSDEKVLERNDAIIQINKVVHGSQSRRSMIEKERETVKNAREKMKCVAGFEDLEEGEIRVHTVSSDEKVLERNGAIVQFNKVVHGSQSRRSMIEKERETAKKAIEKMKYESGFEDNRDGERAFQRLCGPILYFRGSGLMQGLGLFMKK